MVGFNRALTGAGSMDTVCKERRRFSKNPAPNGPDRPWVQGLVEYDGYCGQGRDVVGSGFALLPRNDAPVQRLR
jgi:hypothetical protein